MNVALLAVLGATAGTGACLVAAAISGWVPALPAGRPALQGAPPNRRGAGRRAFVALAAGTVAFLVTRWPVAFALVALAVVGLRGLGGDPAGPVIAKLEAIASWTEMLRDTLAGAAGLTQAVVATASIAPRELRSPVETLAGRLFNGAPLTEALRAFAGEVDDPAADVVVASLIMAASERANRLGDLLGALATSTREEVAMRQGVEASRSSARSAVRTVAGFSMGLLALMTFFARPYLAPYRSGTGQLVLGLVGILFCLGLWLMALMVRPRPAPRLFATAQPR